jgi:hypothetical protein
MSRRRSAGVGFIAACGLAAFAWAEVPGEAPALGADRITQADIAHGRRSLDEIRAAGLRMFTTPFNKLDGYGDGTFNPDKDTLQPGHRPTLQGNGTFLRVNGLDAQTCLECHFIVSNATIPARMGIGGVGGANSNAIIQPTEIDPAGLNELDGVAGFNGRFANPPFLFGAGGVELLAAEMTMDLQALAQQAQASPGEVIELHSKGVSFGSVVWRGNSLDTRDVEGVDPDLVVRPFGRKGEFSTIREFDLGALQFHFGMQPVEVVGAEVDADGDGVTNEALVGELSALSIFLATLESPQTGALSPVARRGEDRFREVGCADCHIPALETRNTELGLRFPEVPTDPLANVFFQVDLTAKPVAFRANGSGGVTVPLFSDLKRHDMGPGLAESFALASDSQNREFVTARLWGIADTAPYLHDGRATTLTEAILLHGGEAQQARDAFAALGAEEQVELLEFLRTLRTPESPAADLLETDNGRGRSPRR